jgi:hypothetical protein
LLLEHQSEYAPTGARFKSAILPQSNGGFSAGFSRASLANRYANDSAEALARCDSQNHPVLADVLRRLGPRIGRGPYF